MNPFRRFLHAVLNDGAPPTRLQQADAFRRAARKRGTVQLVTVLSAMGNPFDLAAPRDYPATTVITVALFDGTRRTLRVYDWESVADRFPAGMVCTMRIPKWPRPLTDQLIPPFAGPPVTPWPPHEPPGDDDFTAQLGLSADLAATDPGDPTGPLVLYCEALTQPIAVDAHMTGAVDAMTAAGWAGLVRLDPITGRPTRVGLYRKPWLAT